MFELIAINNTKINHNTVEVLLNFSVSNNPPAIRDEMKAIPCTILFGHIFFLEKIILGCVAASLTFD